VQKIDRAPEQALVDNINSIFGEYKQAKLQNKLRIEQKDKSKS